MTGSVWAVERSDRQMATLAVGCARRSGCRPRPCPCCSPCLTIVKIGRALPTRARVYGRCALLAFASLGRHVKLLAAKVGERVQHLCAAVIAHNHG